MISIDDVHAAGEFFEEDDLPLLTGESSVEQVIVYDHLGRIARISKALFPNPASRVPDWVDFIDGGGNKHQDFNENNVVVNIGFITQGGLRINMRGVSTWPSQAIPLLILCRLGS